jgi:hypothetical protein
MTKLNRIVRVLTLLCAALAVSGAKLAAQTVAKAPHVAVFYEPGFLYFGVNSQTSPPELVRHLRETGVQAELLGADTLADTNRFNATTFAALVLPYGNTYPDKAFAAMCAFHRSGGALIVSGIPFTHPVARTGAGRWRDLGHRGEAALFGLRGIGIGGFTNSENDNTPTVMPPDPLAIGPLLSNPSAYSHAQRLDPTSLPTGDEVIPVIGAAERPALAIIIHKSAPYAGAVDVWTQHGPDGDLESWLTDQLLLRGTLFALKQKGLLPQDRFQTAAARLAQIPQPPVYKNVVLPTAARPYPTFQPKMPPPARQLFVADVQHVTAAERILLLSLQGLVNRTQPRIYLIVKEADRFWLEEMRRKGDIDSAVSVPDPLSLVEKFRSSVHGAVVSDPNVYLTRASLPVSQAQTIS